MKKTVLFILAAMIIMCIGGCGGQKDRPVLKNSGSGTGKKASSVEKEAAADTAADDADAEKPADEDTAGKDATGDTDKADAVKADTSESNDDAGKADTADDTGKADDAGASGDLITDEQAVDAITDYCYEQNPDLKSIVDEGEYPVYWDISSSDEKEIVVVFRSYTGALTYYHIDPKTGDTYVTELVPGIIDEEQRTDETLNVRDYIK